MLDASHFAFNAIPSGVLTFQAGESEKTITIAIAGNDIEDGNRPFKVSLIDPFGTASMINEHAFAVIQDDDPFTPVITLDASSQITANKSSLINASVDYYDADAILAVAVSVVRLAWLAAIRAALASMRAVRSTSPVVRDESWFLTTTRSAAFTEISCLSDWGAAIMIVIIEYFLN